MARRSTRVAVARQQAVLAAIRRREWLLQMLALGAAGCGRPDGRARAKRSTITILYPGDERGLGPAGDMPSRYLVFLPLVAWNANGNLEGWLAQSWEHSADYREWTVHLRKDVRWHDGVPVTAHDVKFTLDLLSNPETQWWAPPGALSVSVLDDSTYTIAYQAPSIGSPLDGYTVYYPKHLLEKLDPKDHAIWDFWMHPVGNGPYRHVRTVPKTMIELEANADYCRGKPRIELVVLKFGEPSLTELLSGNVDALPYVNDMDVLKLAGDSRFQVYHAIDPDTHVKAIVWNHRHPLFGDPKIRRALTLAINRRELHLVLNLPEETPVFDGIFTREQFLRGEIPEPLPYDPELAKRLLEEAGWHKRTGDEVRQKDGRAFHFKALVLTGHIAGAQIEKTAVYIQAQLRQAGIGMDIRTLDNAAARQRVLAGSFEALILVVNSSLRAPYGYLEFLGERSIIGYGSPEVAALFKLAQVTMDPVEMNRIYSELMSILRVDLPMTFLYPAVWTTAVNRRVRALTDFRAELVQYMEDLWLEDRPER